MKESSVGTNFFAVLTENVNIAFTNEFSLAVLADCMGNPNTVALQPGIYNTGCKMIRNDILIGINWYYNQGTVDFPSWVIGGSGAGGSPTIGLPVVGGSPNDILFVDASGNLGQDDGFFYSDFGEIFHVGFTADSSVGLVVAPLGGLYALGDYGNIYNQTSINLNDSHLATSFLGLQGVSSDVASNGPFPPGTPGYTGSGENDMQWNGYWNNSSLLPVTLTVNIDSLNNATIDYTSLIGTFIVTETITGSTSGATATITADNGSTLTVTNMVGTFTLLEVITGGSSGATADITAISALYDTFQWSDNLGNSVQMIPIDGTNEAIENNIKVIFSDLTGHALDDTWVWDFTVAKGGTQLKFTSNTNSGPSWQIGDIDDLIKGQQFGMSSALGDANDWSFKITDNRGTFFRINPVDAPSAGLYQMGDIDKTNHGTYFNIDDVNQIIGFNGQYGSGGESLLTVNFTRGNVNLGDFAGNVNNTYVTLSDNGKQIEGHSNIGMNLEAFLDIGTLDIPALSTTRNGSFNSITDSGTGNQGVSGVADLSGTGGTKAGAFIAHIEMSGAFSEVVTDNRGSGVGVFSVADDGAGNRFVTSVLPTSFFAGGMTNHTSIGINDATQLITFNGNYSFPFADGMAGQVLSTDGAGTQSWSNPASGDVARAETPSGTINSSNVTFTLAHTPSEILNVMVLLDGIMQYNTVDYTVSGSTITFSTAPITGSTIFAYYRS